jgi:NAD-dependent DNA ligase
MGEVMKDLLAKASQAYYAGTPVMSDAEFDILAAHFDYKTVGHTITGGVPHFYRMYSLQNCFNIEASPIDLKDCVETPKLDGAAVSILYTGGEISLALTRGDGRMGKDVTDKVALLVPNTIDRPGIVQINGEIVAPKDIPNSRNFAAGALGLKSVSEFKTRPLTFVAYQIEQSNCDSWVEDMHYLENQRFKVVTQFVTDRYPTDGLVYRINDNAVFAEMGHTSHHPRGAFALKEQKEGVITELLDVVWQVGKSGAVSPVAILKPCEIGGATVARATLHNIKYINELNLEIGCQVEVIRSGEVIPRIVRRVC